MGVIRDMFVRLSAGSKQSGKTIRPTGISSRYVRRLVSRTKRDIQDWKTAEQRAMSPSDPRFYLLQDLYREITNDALLSSQMNNRIGRTQSAPYELVDAAGNVDDEMTDRIMNLTVVHDIIRYIVESRFYGNSVVEIVEYGPAEKIFNRPQHSYTKKLISSNLLLNIKDKNGLLIIEWE